MSSEQSDALDRGDYCATCGYGFGPWSKVFALAGRLVCGKCWTNRATGVR